MKRKKILYFFVIAILFFSGGCAGLSKDIEVSSLAQKKRHHEIISILQQDVDRKEAISAFQLYLLSGAYYEIRDYEKMLSTVDMLEKQIGRGDVTYYFGADMSVYPGILRGAAYLDQGEYDKAVKAASAAHVLLNKIGKSNVWYHSQLIDVAGILGVANAFLNRNEEADRWLEVLRNIDISEGTLTLGPQKFTAIARIHMAKKECPQALSAIQDPKATVSGFITYFYDQTFEELPKFFILTKCQYETGKTHEAKDNYDQLLKHPQIKQVGGIYWPSLLDRGRIARINGQDKIAEALFSEAADVIEKQRASIISEAGRIGYVGDKQAIYQELVALLISGGRAAEAFEYVERSKSRALVDLLASNKEFSVPKDKEQVASMLKELETIESEGKAIDISSIAPEKASQRNIRSVQIKERIKNLTPELTSLVTVSIPPPTEIQSNIGADETLVEYYYHGEDLYAFVLNRNALKAVKLDGKGILNDIEQFRRLLQDPSSTQYAELSQRLYQRLIKPVENLIATTKLIIVPHGMFESDSPLNSGLFLSRDAENDGLLRVSELYSISMNADMVTLSACETALGKINAGDDVVGLQRGFLYAGANSIVASLWKVDDLATSQLMTGFYFNLKKTNKRDALREAQLAVKKQYDHPYFWAAFQLTGMTE